MASMQKEYKIVLTEDEAKGLKTTLGKMSSKLYEDYKVPFTAAQELSDLYDSLPCEEE